MKENFFLIVNSLFIGIMIYLLYLIVNLWLFWVNSLYHIYYYINIYITEIYTYKLYYNTYLYKII